MIHIQKYAQMSQVDSLVVFIQLPLEAAELIRSSRRTTLRSVWDGHFYRRAYAEALALGERLLSSAVKTDENGA